MTRHPRPVLLVLDDREGLVRAAPGFARLRERCDVQVLERPLTEVNDAGLADVRLLLAIRERTRPDAATLARFPRLELLLQTGSHAYHVDAGQLRRRRIPVARGRRAQAVRSALQQLTLLLMLACLRRVREATPARAAGDWPALVGRTLSGRRLGVLGLGRHGRRVTGLGPDGVVLLPLAELLASCDVVSVHLRLSEEPLPAEHPLRALPNAVLTPHVGWTTEEVLTEYAEMTAGQAADYLSGVLDPEELPDVLPGPDALGGLRGAVSA